MNSTADGSDADSAEAPREPNLPTVVEIAPSGDLVLDMTFENSRATLTATRKVMPKLGQPSAPAPVPKARARVGFRVSLGVLQRQSKYFEKLLGNTRFKEARDIAATLEALTIRNVDPAAAHVKDLPWVKIVDDDAATRYAHRESAFADMLRILHGSEPAKQAVTLDFVATLAVFADRFDCAPSVGKYMTSGLKLKWPATQRKLLAGEDPRMSRHSENVVRQKILVSWLLNQPVKLQAATRELILNGSCKWTSFPEQNDATEDATWWYLQEGLEQELQFRRECILNTIASVPRHFLGLYTSRTRQCKLGYDSSSACDSYQLGEMLKFLTNKNLLFLVDFSPSSLNLVADTSLLPVDTILATLRQCPGYQIDKNHTNCGLRTRMLPLLDFIQALLSANSVPIARVAWKNDRQATAWLPWGDEETDKNDTKPFCFTRSMAGDQRLRFEHTLGADKFAKEVFTASGWNWTAEV